MYKPIEIKENLFYVGVNDRNKHLFENLWPLPNGVSYNSYLIIDDKIALIDTVDICYSELFLEKIKTILGEKQIDYLIVNHMEPDHSGSIGLLRSKYPDLQIVGNSRTADMLKGYYGITDNIVVIQDKEEISLGRNTLRFYLTPMVHWPETMMTYLVDLNVLFSADAFGTFGTLDGGVLDTQLNPEKYWEEMIRYYSNIVGKFGSSVQTALKKLSDIEIKTICSTHGPVWTQPETIEKVVSIYDRLSKYESDNGLVIVYGSMYGHTEQVAEIVAASAALNGIKEIVIHNVAKSSLSDIIRDVFKYRGLVIGSATYNNKIYPGVESVLSALQNRGVKNRYFGYFSGHTWADGAKRDLKAFVEGMGFELTGESIEMKQAPTSTVIEQAYALGESMAEKLKSNKPIVLTQKECI